MSAAPSIAVVVPVLNEEAAIGALLERLRPHSRDCEIVFVDGGSTDATRDVVAAEFRVIEAPRGRGGQLNAGARATRADALFFLHADSAPPDDFPDEIRDALTTGEAGCFGISFDTPSLLMRICAALSNFRAYRRRIMFGDQGMFMTRDLFERMGGFPELPLMEDCAFSLALRAAGVRPGKTRRRIVTSARRFGSSTTSRLSTMYHMARLRRMYREGVPIERISREYADVWEKRADR